ncbi:MAG: methionyl-tRNA formyltransferase [Promicromonosporaceae bacterium]|nr:methionyl-tRNA formyltransferase [Promicromonosporaceae bacterium]
MRIIFAGTPAVAVPVLQALLESQHQVVAVLTRADAPTGRGKKTAPSPVRVAAEEAGIPVLTGVPSDPETLREIAALDCDAAVVVAYGHLLRQHALDLMPHGWFNMHFSLLPELRGAAPVQWAIIEGFTETGVSIFRLDPGMDTGPVFASASLAIEPAETAGALLWRLAVLGTDLVVRVLDDVAAGIAAGVSQVGEPSYAVKLTTDTARVDWGQSAVLIDRLIRGVTPDPGAWCELLVPGREPLRLGLGPVAIMTGEELMPDEGLASSETPVPGATLAPGELRVSKREVLVGTGSVPVRLGEVKPAGKKPMAAADWARGAGLTAGARLA